MVLALTLKEIAYFLVLFGGIVVWFVRLELLAKQNRRDVIKMEQDMKYGFDSIQNKIADTGRMAGEAREKTYDKINELNQKIDAKFDKIYSDMQTILLKLSDK